MGLVAASAVAIGAWLLIGPSRLRQPSVTPLPGPKKKQGQILALGHGDTVWPVGTLQSMPFREADGRLWGPGVLDMKAGLVLAEFAKAVGRPLNDQAGCATPA